jgi:hypothetical protein
MMAFILFLFSIFLLRSIQFFSCLLDQLMALDQFVHGAHGREANGVLGTGVDTGDTGHHAVQGGKDDRFFLSIIKAIDHPATAGNAQPTADTQLFIHLRMPVNFFPGNSMPRLYDVIHRQISKKS